MCLSVCEPLMTVCLCVSQGHSVVFRIYLLREQVVGFSVALKDDVTKVILWLSQEILSSQDESGHKEDTIFIFLYISLAIIGSSRIMFSWLYKLL